MLDAPDYAAQQAEIGVAMQAQPLTPEGMAWAWIALVLFIAWIAVTIWNVSE
jgi:hypothetical protein